MARNRWLSAFSTRRKTIHLVRATDDKKIEAIHCFHATCETVDARDREVDAVLATEPDYNGSHLRIGRRVCDLIDKTDYASRRELERGACHFIMTLAMYELKSNRDFGREMRAAPYWVVYVWYDANGKIRGHLHLAKTLNGIEKGGQLPPLDRINVWNGGAHVTR